MKWIDKRVEKLMNSEIINSTKACDGCHCIFTMTNRKHHCRVCGGLFCGSCSNKKVLLNEKLKRSCESCYLEDQNNLINIKDKANSVKCEFKKLTMRRIREKKSKILGVVLDSPFVSVDNMVGDCLAKVCIL